MLEDNYVTFEIGKAKHIALVAHDGKKKELVDWCDKNKDVLKMPLSVRNRHHGQTDRGEDRPPGQRIQQRPAGRRPADWRQDRGRPD